MPVILVVLGTFALCFAVDKGFTKIFRGKKEHQSGLSVKLNKKYGLVGILLTVLGVAALIAGIREGSGLLMVGGPIVSLMGVGLLVYYMSFGIFYDEDGFILTTFGKKSVTYRYHQISHQQVYIVQGGNVLVELHMTDGKTVSVQGTMEGAPSFLSKAAHARMRQLMLNSHECPWFDETEGRWFPPVEE
mgnify:CR=1 FL=1